MMREGFSLEFLFV
jgi:hypothetical protein